MKIFLTGATGFLGRRVVEGLVEAGHAVTALVRNPDAYAATVKAGRRSDFLAQATLVRGSLEDLDSAKEALAESDAVIHLASLVGDWAPWSRYRRVVVDATARLLEAADAGGVKRFVYVSSEAVLQAGAPLLDVDETAPPPRSPSSRYGRAKLAAERAVLGYEGPIERVILRPPFIWGDGNEVTARFASLAEAGKLPLIDGGASSFEHIHVDNAAAAVIAALTGGRDRDVYFITNGEPMPVAEFLAGILGAYDAPAPRRSLPSRLLRPVASVLQGVWAGLRLPGAPPLTPFEVEFFSLPRRFHIDAARRDLGYQPAVSFADGVDRLARAVKAK